jgi:hypothetical protein
MTRLPDPFEDRLLPEVNHLCVVEAMLSDMQGALKVRQGPKGKYWKLSYGVVLRFKGAKLQARARWKDEVRRIFLLAQTNTDLICFNKAR